MNPIREQLLQIAGRIVLGGSTIAVAVVAGQWVAGALPTWAAGTDPSTEEIPTLDFADPAKSMVVRLDFGGRTDASFDHAVVSFERAHASLADPPLLRVELENDAGATVKVFNAWHPLWAFAEDSAGGEQRIIRSSASGRFAFPFQPDLATMTVTDVPLNEEVIEVDLTPTIRRFCETNPTDPDCEIADLAVADVLPVDPPPLVLMGQPEVVTVRTTMTNLGPDAPMDAVLETTAAASAGLDVFPSTTQQLNVPTLALNELRPSERGYRLTCEEPGLHTVTFTSVVDAQDAAVSDPDTSNNQRQATLTVDCAVPIAINIKPGSNPNSINRRGAAVPVALLTTAAGEYGTPLAFDATTVDPLSTHFAPRADAATGIGATEIHGRGHVEDSRELDDEKMRDGDDDMVLHFDPGDSGLELEDMEACIKGSFEDGGSWFTFFGCDSVRIVR